MITNRDMKTLRFIDEFHVAHTSTLCLFYGSLRVTQNRLKELVRMKELDRIRYHYTQEYIYYKKRKPSQLRHELLLTDFYRELGRRVNSENIRFKKEFTGIDGIRPDGLVGFKGIDGMIKTYFVEVEISKKGLDLDKYVMTYADDECWNKLLPVFPDMVVITDDKIKWDNKNGQFKVYRVGTDFTGDWDFI